MEKCEKEKKPSGVHNVDAVQYKCSINQREKRKLR